MSIDAMKQALEALEEIKSDTFHPAKVFKHNPAITALRAAITEAERQEPVAEIISNDTTYDIRILDFNYLGNGTKLYTTPQPAIPAWQPIETAPRDGTPILAFTNHDNAYVVSYDDCFSAPWRIFNDQGLNERAIIYWMPLPAAPKEQK